MHQFSADKFNLDSRAKVSRAVFIFFLNFLCELLLICDDRLVLSKSVNFTHDIIETIVNELCINQIYVGLLLISNSTRFVYSLCTFVCASCTIHNKKVNNNIVALVVRYTQ